MYLDNSRVVEIEDKLIELNSQLEQFQKSAHESEYHSNMCEVILFDIFNYEEELHALTDVAIAA